MFPVFSQKIFFVKLLRSEIFTKSTIDYLFQFLMGTKCNHDAIKMAGFREIKGVNFALACCIRKMPLKCDNSVNLC